ncbi:hypothetical protein AAF712_015497 [Marasmius tenuissimus]|uniref:Uncharacterized protein n=1 Tax=Marasmius tenuissimus TaxID=585030 RepID=A0ABR2Z9D1_9AGAR
MNDTDLVLDPGNPRVHDICVGLSPYDASYSDYVHALGPVFALLTIQLREIDEDDAREVHRERFARMVVENWLGEWGEEEWECLNTGRKKRDECKVRVDCMPPPAGLVLIMFQEIITHVMMESTMHLHLANKGLQPALDHSISWEEQFRSALEKSRYTRWKEPEYAQLLQPKKVSVEPLESLPWDEACEKFLRESNEEFRIWEEKEERKKQAERERRAGEEHWSLSYQ